MLSRIDYKLFIPVLIICAISLLSLYSINSGSYSETNYFMKQTIWVVIGIAVYLFFQLLPVKVNYNYAYAYYAFIILMLIFVYFFGNETNGSRRWFLLGPIKIQPSEPAKFITILALGRFISDSHTDLTRFKDLAIALLLIFIPFYLIKEQPDLGTSLTFIIFALPVLFYGGMPGFYIYALITTCLLVLLTYNMLIFFLLMSVFILGIYFFKGSPYLKVALILIYIVSGFAAPKIWNDVLKPHQRSRILALINPENIKGAGYQAHQSKVAIGSGGDIGKGLTKGTQVQLGLVPEAHSDMIICIWAEEFGFIGVITLLGLFAFLILRLVYYAYQTKTQYSGLVLIGVATLLLYHVFTNMGMAIGLMPVTGLPLPFMSYGGSFMLTNMMVMGICGNIIVNKYDV